MNAGDSGERIPQAAAIPFRREAGGTLAVLLIRRLHRSAWGIPKGLIDPGLTPQQAALMEALEEAGVEGELLTPALGEFEYRKFGGICRVQVFAMRVTKVHDEYDEKPVRHRQWLAAGEAAELVERSELRPMIRSLNAMLNL